MRFTSALSATFVGGIAFGTVLGGGILNPRRTTSILHSPDAQPDLPTPSQAAAAAAAAALNLSNIQGDILIGMKKRVEVFFFFQIRDAKSFKKGLKLISSKITTTTQLLDVSRQPDVALNVAFSQAGLTALGVTDSMGDQVFSAGQFMDAAGLGDPGTINWVPAFARTGIHGVFLLASDSVPRINTMIYVINLIFGSSLSEMYRLQGQSRPGDQQGHEHFGFMDGVSQPAVIGFTPKPLPGQVAIDAGAILLGERGDSVPRPKWAKGGSFLVFRQLKQLVPEFNKFLADNPIVKPGLSRKQGSDLLGARMIGRWKSGAPVDLAPLFDDPVLANDPHRNNDFNYTHINEDQNSNQTRCPFSSHIRKVAPRADFDPVDTTHHIIRAGIPYGPEVSYSEAATNTTIAERGLAFVAYQADIGNGFQFLQKNWANTPSFFPGKTSGPPGSPNATTFEPGFDPIIGSNAAKPRPVRGLDPTHSSREFTLMVDFVQSRGGEYFFSPPISAITDVLAK